MKTIEVKKVTAVLLVEEIEPCLNFWVERLGFTKTTEVPDGNKLAFVILQKGATEVMYQTFASVEKDNVEAAKDARKGPTFLYVEVGDLDAVIAALKGVPVVMPVRTTFYGAKEIGVKDPAGHFVTFAQYGAAAQH
ncbi:MAG: VOC family protein [Candidatus Acidiferrales bacterium]